MAAARTGGTKEIAQNRKAFHDYFILDRFEAGIHNSGKGTWFHWTPARV